MTNRQKLVIDPNKVEECILYLRIRKLITETEVAAIRERLKGIRR